MFITKGHFLSPFTLVIKDGKPLPMLHSIDTDLLVAIRIVGFDQQEDTPLLDLVKVEEVKFETWRMPSHIADLLPKNFKIAEEGEYEDGKDSID